MAFDRSRHHRRSIRLPHYDYAQPGAYFVTICTHARICLLGEIADEEMHLSPAGEIVREEWLRTAEVRQNVIVDAFIVMPNHVHGIIGIVDHGVEPEDSAVPDRRGVLQYAPTRARDDRSFRSPSQTLGAIVRGFKGATTKRINGLGGTPGAKVWQRNYYERVLRNDRELDLARCYIRDNPLQWTLDRLYPG